jgi:DNA-binding Lrp family transcriptional regulator
MPRWRAGWGWTEAEVIARMAAMQATGVIRRIAVAPNHYALGMAANGMSVWDVTDEDAVALGAKVGALDFVSHCYLRPRALPDWPYNLFAMLHGSTRDEVEAKRREVAALLGPACRGHDILYSTRILKKTGPAPDRRRLMFRLTQYMHELVSPTPVRTRGATGIGQARGDLEPDADLQPEMPALLYHQRRCAVSGRVEPRSGHGRAGRPEGLRHPGADSVRGRAVEPVRFLPAGRTGERRWASGICPCRPMARNWPKTSTASPIWALTMSASRWTGSAR